MLVVAHHSVWYIVYMYVCRDLGRSRLWRSSDNWRSTFRWSERRCWFRSQCRKAAAPHRPMPFALPWRNSELWSRRMLLLNNSRWVRCWQCVYVCMYVCYVMLCYVCFVMYVASSRNQTSTGESPRFALLLESSLCVSPARVEVPDLSVKHQPLHCQPLTSWIQSTQYPLLQCTALG
jgi:hypothetical protein